MPVVIDTAGGVAYVGTLTVPVEATGRDGELRVHGGATLRPLRFGERLRICSRALSAREPRAAVAGAVADAAVLDGGADGERLLLEVLALALAGAGEDAPPFADAAALVARSAGWEPAQLLEVEAAQVDRLARQLGGRRTESRTGSTRIVFAPRPADELAALRAELADDLLDRAGQQVVEVVPPLAPQTSDGTRHAEAEPPAAPPGDGVPEQVAAPGPPTPAAPAAARPLRARVLAVDSEPVGRPDLALDLAGPRRGQRPAPEPAPAAVAFAAPAAAASAAPAPAAAAPAPAAPARPAFVPQRHELPEQAPTPPAASPAPASDRSDFVTPGHKVPGPGSVRSGPASTEPAALTSASAARQVLVPTSHEESGRTPAFPAPALPSAHVDPDFVHLRHKLPERPLAPTAAPVPPAPLRSGLLSPSPGAAEAFRTTELVQAGAPAAAPLDEAVVQAHRAFPPASVARVAARRPATAAREVASTIARLLHAEADLRGIAR